MYKKLDKDTFVRLLVLTKINIFIKLELGNQCTHAEVFQK
jgi:hypothetical protein